MGSLFILRDNFFRVRRSRNGAASLCKKTRVEKLICLCKKASEFKQAIQVKGLSLQYVQLNGSRIGAYKYIGSEVRKISIIMILVGF